MTRKEQAVQSIQKEIDKLEKSLNRYKGLLEKKIAKCEKLNCNWNQEEYFAKRDSGELTQETFNAWFEKYGYERDVADTERRLENATKRLQKAIGEWEVEIEQNEAEQEFLNNANAIESNWLSIMKAREEEYKRWLENFKAECLQDGIVIDEATASFMNGTTKNGKQFCIYINSGWTDRSNHCYTLRINGTTYFTSGTFCRCYKYMKCY